MKSYTPGPWKRGAMANGPNRIYAEDLTICRVEFVSNGGRWPNGDTEGPRLHALGKANARLIAAAPDLYESLFELVNSTNAKQNDMWDRARKALKKVVEK